MSETVKILEYGANGKKRWRQVPKIRFMAELTTGEVVELVKDCGCLVHQGPHWIDVDEMDRRSNKEILDRGCWRGFVIEDLARLQRKLVWMKRLGIQRYWQEEASQQDRQAAA